ncbi:MAG: hypothetical protein ACKOJF_29300 [Planctomycetaceae bacterium]
MRRSWFQTDGLAFASVLTAEDMQAEFEAEGVSFSEREIIPDDGLVHTPAITLWALLSQMLFTGAQRSCRSAVIRVAVYCSLCGRRISQTNTGACCRARAKIPHTVIQRLTQRVARGCEAAAPYEWRWHDRTVRVADGLGWGNGRPVGPVNRCRGTLHGPLRCRPVHIPIGLPGRVCVRFMIARPHRAANRPNGPAIPPARVEGPGCGGRSQTIPSGPTGRPFHDSRG